MMESHLIPDIVSQIQNSRNILVCTHRKPDGDAIGSMLGLALSLMKMGKTVTAVCPDRVPDSFHFLQGTELVRQDLSGAREFVVTLDCKDTEVDRLKYQLENGKLHIIITPKKGRFLKEQVTLDEHSAKFDLIIATDVADEKQLGHLYEEHRELFIELPVINVDHHATNTHFGRTNWIDSGSCSASEMVLRLVRELEKESGLDLLDSDIATYLLAGITTDTGSFQHSNTTPKALEAAADLIDAGAKQQDLIKHVFRTKKLSTLKLWGLILSKIQSDERHRMAWSEVTQRDLLSTDAELDESSSIIDELMLNAPDKDIIILFKEEPSLISVSFRSTTPAADVAAIAEHFGGGGHVQASGAKIPGRGLTEVMHEVLSYAMDLQAERLGLKVKADVPSFSDGVVPQVLEDLPFDSYDSSFSLDEGREVPVGAYSDTVMNYGPLSKAMEAVDVVTSPEPSALVQQELSSRKQTDVSSLAESPSLGENESPLESVPIAPTPVTTFEARKNISTEKMFGATITPDIKPFPSIVSEAPIPPPEPARWDQPRAPQFGGVHPADQGQSGPAPTWQNQWQPNAWAPAPPPPFSPPAFDPSSWQQSGYQPPPGPYGRYQPPPGPQYGGYPPPPPPAWPPTGQ